MTESAAPAHDSGDPRAVVLEQLACLNERRLEERVALFAADAEVVVSGDGPVARGRDAILAQSRAIDAAVPGAIAVPVAVWVDGATVVVEGRYEFGEAETLPFALVAEVNDGLCRYWHVYFDASALPPVSPP